MSKKRVVLFDFDGVIMDTEGVYTEFWNKRGEKYLGIQEFGELVKGSTDTVIYDKYFSNQQALISKINEEVIALEENMTFEYIAGAHSFLYELKNKGLQIGMATSSDQRKMKLVYQQHPDLKQLLDCVITSDEVNQPKPSPESYLKAMKILGVGPEETVIFEDSLFGLQAARSAGAVVVGVSTSHTEQEIAKFCDHIIPDFSAMTYKRLLEFYK